MAAAVVDGFQSYKKYKWIIYQNCSLFKEDIKDSPIILLVRWDFVQRPTANLEIGKQEREYGLRIYPHLLTLRFAIKTVWAKSIIHWTASLYY